MIRLGVHCSVRQGYRAALEQARILGCETLQIFTLAPRLWRTAALSDEEARSFRARRKDLGLHPLIAHTPYMPNLFSMNEKIYRRSAAALEEDLSICEKLEADYLVIHPGAYSEGSSFEEGLKRFAQAVNPALRRGGRVQLLIENMAGGGRRIGSQWEELKAMLNAVEHLERIAFCLDTAHTYAAGHPFSDERQVLETLRGFDRHLSLSRLRLIHANDSAAPAGSHRDLHQHIGQGHLGLRPFDALLNHPALQHCAAILETPRTNPEDDASNLARVRALRGPSAV